MKNHITLFLFLTLPMFVFSQGIMNLGGTDTGEGDKETLDLATIRVYYYFTQKSKSDSKPFRSDTMTLDIGATHSYYYDETKIQKDSLYNSVMNNLNVTRINSITVLKDNDRAFENYLGDITTNSFFDGTTEKIYKNRSNNELTITDFSSNPYRCEDKLGALEWKITEDTATVLNYQCQKATISFRGRNYEAWFAPEIPINDGPWKFLGLPGLILRVTDDANLISFEGIGLQFLQTPYPIKIAKLKYMNCNRKELAKVIRRRGGSISIGNQGGNLTVVQKSLDNNFEFLEND